LWKLLKDEEACLTIKIPQLSKGSSEGSGITLEVPNEPKDNFVVAEKQAGYVKTNLTLSSAKLEIQSMVDVPIHQEDLAIHELQSLTLHFKRSLEVLVGARKTVMDKRLLQRTV
ncbi:hypothetical protein Tco_1390227, partial [Tanacetum coccineum]